MTQGQGGHQGAISLMASESWLRQSSTSSFNLLPGAMDLTELPGTY